MHSPKAQSWPAGQSVWTQQVAFAHSESTHACWQGSPQSDAVWHDVTGMKGGKHILNTQCCRRGQSLSVVHCANGGRKGRQKPL